LDEWAEDRADPAVRAITRAPRKVTRKWTLPTLAPPARAPISPSSPTKANDAIDAPADQGGAVGLPGGNAG